MKRQFLHVKAEKRYVYFDDKNGQLQKPVILITCKMLSTVQKYSDKQPKTLLIHHHSKKNLVAVMHLYDQAEGSARTKPK